ncbi:Regulator of nonsense transcripts 3A [Sarcoptes scabiei]|uniref:Regulator of nonsense transcripts 3A n=1 Tax=Sarcoptes scabiei TaxID=52283 RepID=A0A834R4Q6_SARSC|nr:Regulator of nonsense transcripts 3A [Sarcoptes scabiei]
MAKDDTVISSNTKSTFNKDNSSSQHDGDLLRKSKNFDAKSIDKKKKYKPNSSDFITRIVARQLPPTLNEEQFLETVGPLAPYSEFYYVHDYSIGEYSFSRAYIKFKNYEDVICFKNKFDDYVFVDSKGNEFPAIVEFAPLQRLPRRFNLLNIKKDTKVNTYENDPDFIAFAEQLDKPMVIAPQITTEQILEEIESRESRENISQITPLVEYLNRRHSDKIQERSMNEEKRRKKEERRKKRKRRERKEKKEKNKSLNKNSDFGSNVKISAEKDKPNEPKFIKLLSKNGDKNSDTGQNKELYLKENKSNDIKQMEKKREFSKDDTKNDGQSNSNNIEKAIKAENKPAEIKRIRNKDRPSREIYRPKILQENDRIGGDSSSSKDKPTVSKENNRPSIRSSADKTAAKQQQKSSTSSLTNRSKQQNQKSSYQEKNQSKPQDGQNNPSNKFKRRVFVRSNKN